MLFCKYIGLLIFNSQKYGKFIYIAMDGIKSICKYLSELLDINLLFCLYLLDLYTYIFGF